MFFIENDIKSSIKPEYSVTQSSALMDPQKWAIADVLSGKNVVSKVDHCYNEL